MRRTATAAAIALLLTGAPALADEEADIQAGANLAKRWCSECHVVGPDIKGGDIGPSFESVAQRPDLSEQDVKTWLADPHPPMDTLNLSAAETKVLTRYLFSLQK